MDLFSWKHTRDRHKIHEHNYITKIYKYSKEDLLFHIWVWLVCQTTFTRKHTEKNGHYKLKYISSPVCVHLLNLFYPVYIDVYFLVEDLSILTLASKAMRNLIEGYRVLSPCLTNKLVQQLHATNNTLPVEKQSDYLREFNKQGLLIF